MNFDNVIIPTDNFKIKMTPSTRIVYGAIYSACNGGKNKKQITMTEMARELNTTIPSISANIKKLQSLGLIKVQSGDYVGQANSYEII